jgi:hypothetical protein
MFKKGAARTVAFTTQPWTRRVNLTLSFDFPAIGMLIIFLAICPNQAGMSASDETCAGSRKSNIIDYVGNYNAALHPQRKLEALFTTSDIRVDGIVDAAYADAPESAIDNFKTGTGYTDYLYPAGSEPRGVLRTVWDGPMLYLLVQVRDATPMRGTQAGGGAIAIAKTAKPAVPADRDSVQFGFDLYNDKVPYETDTIGLFTVGSDGALYFYRNPGIPSLGSVMADPIHPEYMNRIESYAAQDVYASDGVTVIGYNIEAAIHIEKAKLKNGCTIGIDVSINDVAGSVTMTAQNRDGTTKQTAGPARVGISFWSHDQEDLYADYDPERPNAVDWGNITLAGWDGKSAFKSSDWRLTNAVRYLDSIAFPKDVYTQATQAVLDAARRKAEPLIKEPLAGAREKAKIDAAADRLEAAIAGLRWADTRYPDPADLPVQNTLPNPYKFFGSNRLVQTASDWQERRAEILNLAQFYEYGFKPGPPDSIEVMQIKHVNAGDNILVFSWNGKDYFQKAACPQELVTIRITVGGRSSELTYTVYLPTPEQLKNSGRSDRLSPVVLSFDGDNEAYRNAGYAVVRAPQGSDGDVRTNEYAWGNRTGAFYELYPYSRNGEGALREVSSEMAAAWSASRVIDSLEKIGASAIPGASVIGAAVDTSKLAITGFSINGKYAFVSAVFDERISVCIPGAAGASGPSPWRYVYIGQEYDWAGTLYAPAASTGKSPQQVATGTEFMANSIRHNRVRETELFRRFLTPGRFYERLPGAYGFGTRLPYDQNDLVATLAPRAIVLVNTVNDYNDGSLADSLSLQISKSVYKTLGFDGDDLVKFNQRPVQGPGDPHGQDATQWVRTVEYLNHYFYGTEMSESAETWLNNDPFNLKVSNNRTETPYDFYYGGFNAITGGAGGAAGRDGWYYYTFSGAAGGAE